MTQKLSLEQKTLKFTDFEALNEQELREIEGGIAPVVGAAIIVGGVYLLSALWHKAY